MSEQIVYDYLLLCRIETYQEGDQELALAEEPTERLHLQWIKGCFCCK